ncbi:hypothetical protein [Bacillus massiliglaciei]|uniref:hypothetical protein n=1 Tax=Bacillus massiliglaciei TaxID=1816693 RepID=UPI0018FEDBB0|nr:hypothetical protein [Bacillus massiliglaciei]
MKKGMFLLLTVFIVLLWHVHTAYRPAPEETIDQLPGQDYEKMLPLISEGELMN